MEAPDKIFLPRNIDCPSAAILTLGNQPGDVEYIRKDALLEWANDVKQGLIVEVEKYGAPYEQRVFAFQEFIDKINSL